MSDGADELTVIASGPACDVVMLAGLYKNRFVKLDVAARAALEELMRLVGEVGWLQMPKTQLNGEGRHDVGHGKSVLLMAFKDGCHRIYGAVVSRGERPTFVCTAIDDNKKRQRADQEVLKQAARKLKPFVHEVLESEDTRFDTRPTSREKRNEGRKKAERKGRR